MGFPNLGNTKLQFLVCFLNECRTEVAIKYIPLKILNIGMFMQLFIVYTMSLLFFKFDLPNNPYEVSGIVNCLHR